MSLCHAVGIPEMVVYNYRDYEEYAVRLATTEKIDTAKDYSDIPKHIL